MVGGQNGEMKVTKEKNIGEDKRTSANSMTYRELDETGREPVRMSRGMLLPFFQRTKH